MKRKSAHTSGEGQHCLAADNMAAVGRPLTCAIPKKIYRPLYFLSLSFIVTQTVMDICYYLSVHLNVLSTSQYNHIVSVIFIMLQAIDFVLSVSLIAIFVQRLRSLNIDIGINDPYHNQELNDQQMKIVRSMSKSTVLSCIAILSSQCVFIYIAILFWINDSDNLGYTRFIMVAWDCIINSVCVILNFDFADGCYYHLCCCFDYCCTKLCGYQAKRQQTELRQRLLTEPYKL